MSEALGHPRGQSTTVRLGGSQSTRLPTSYAHAVVLVRSPVLP